MQCNDIYSNDAVVISIDNIERGKIINELEHAA